MKQKRVLFSQGIENSGILVVLREELLLDARKDGLLCLAGSLAI